MRGTGIEMEVEIYATNLELRFLGHSARSQSLYQLRYPGSSMK
jgi:hypothetical protein